MSGCMSFCSVANEVIPTRIIRLTPYKKTRPWGENVPLQKKLDKSKSELYVDS